MGSKNYRQLAAVMFTDIVGYTATMQESETKANKQRKQHQTVLQKRTREFGGKVTNFYGDGAITVFNSAYKAVMCAINTQLDLKTQSLPLRIGLHMGDIVCSSKEVYGDAVNIASRLEGLATVGSILLSEKMKDEIRNNAEIKTVQLGFFHLKNVKQPVNVFAVCNRGLSVPDTYKIMERGEKKHRIMVLPFITMSSEKGFEYFSDGLTEEIINGLTKIEEIDVTSRTSAFVYKERNVDVRQIGREHVVTHVLEGSVRKHGGKIRITAQLIETERGFHLWSETYEQHLKDIFVVQDFVCDKILQKVRRSLCKDQDLNHEEEYVKNPDFNRRPFPLKKLLSGFVQPSLLAK